MTIISFSQLHFCFSVSMCCMTDYRISWPYIHANMLNSKKQQKKKKKSIFVCLFLFSNLLYVHVPCSRQPLAAYFRRVRAGVEW